YVADNYLGYQRSIILGGALIALGMFMLLIPQLQWFLAGLAVIVAGNGLFKPNISTMVGALYAPQDSRRDSGFTIFYMGINAGAFVAPIVCASVVGARFGYRYGFLAAGVGMVSGIVVFQFLAGMLGHIGKAPAGREGVKPVLVVLGGAAAMVPLLWLLLSKSEVLGYVLIGLMLFLVLYFLASGIRSGDRVQLQRYGAMLLLFLANCLFWALFEQAGSSLNFLARDFVDAPFHFTLFQSANPLFILLLAPLFALLWPALERGGRNPSIPRKFAIALIGAGSGFLLLALAIGATPDGAKVPWLFLVLTYLVHTMAELCLSPIGLSMVTKLAARHEVGMAMGGWFLSTAMANYLAGLIAAVASGGGGHGAASSLVQYAATFTQLWWLALAIGGSCFLCAPLINRLMHGVK
nr:peptide MFS transporter [Pseudomonadales bacterium]